MKTKTLLTVFTAITLLAMTPAFTLSQIDRSSPNAQTSVSDFSIPQDMGVTVNSADGESAPFVASNGLSLYFSGNPLGGGFGGSDIWVCQRPTLTSAWGAPQNLGAVINTDSNDNRPALSLDGLTMFFNSSRLGGSGSNDIYLSTRTDPTNDFSWTAPVNLGPAINTGSSELGAAYYEDPATDTPILYFASNRSGNFDIYQSKRNPNGTFNAPSIITVLNSGSNELDPAISRNGLEMLFSTNRDAGNDDIWVSTRASVSHQWSPPVNLTAVNSEFDETNPALSPDGAVLFFASTRDGGSGSNDIYTAHRLCTSSK